MKFFLPSKPPAPEPPLYDLWTIRKFLWWPKRIGMEIRWLETACWVQRWEQVGWRMPRSFQLQIWRTFGWNCLKFVDYSDDYRHLPEPKVWEVCEGFKKFIMN